MLQVKFGFDWPSGFRGDVSSLWTTTTTTEHGLILLAHLTAQVSYKWRQRLDMTIVVDFKSIKQTKDFGLYRRFRKVYPDMGMAGIMGMSPEPFI